MSSCSYQSIEEVLYTFSGRTMGTVFNVKIVKDDPGTDFTFLEAEIIEILDEVNRQMSTYRDDSEITGFNNFNSTEWYSVSKDFVDVIGKALEISRLSEGAFDITVGPVVNVWGFGPEIKELVIPPGEELERAKSKTGYHLISFSLDPPKIKKSISDVYIDLSAIAKGFGVDKVCGYLDTQNINNYLVEIGGEVRVKGNNHNGQPWQIGVEKPDETGSLENVIGLTDLSLATSGDYHNYFEVEGKRYSHTIDPRTARPVRHSLASVSVLHESCTLADGFATAINVLGPEAGFEFAFNQNLPVYMIVRQDGRFVEKSTPSFSKLLKNK
jgi:thiamine biosynthesis lipoprotein